MAVGAEDPSEGFGGRGGAADSPSRGGPSGADRGGGGDHETALPARPSAAAQSDAQAAENAAVGHSGGDGASGFVRAIRKALPITPFGLWPVVYDAFIRPVNRFARERGVTPHDVDGESFPNTDQGWMDFGRAKDFADSQRGGVAPRLPATAAPAAPDSGIDTSTSPSYPDTSTSLSYPGREADEVARVVGQDAAPAVVRAIARARGAAGTVDRDTLAAELRGVLDADSLGAFLRWWDEREG